MVGGGIVLDMVYMVREECKDFQGQMEIYGCHLGFDLLLIVEEESCDWLVAPPIGLIKLNFDGSFLGNFDQMGIGGVIRDHSGTVLRAFSSQAGVGLAIEIYLYLGLPLGGNPIACGFWDPVIKRIFRRLDGWQKAYLSFGGRITLLHSCLSHIPSYFLSLFKIPASVAAKIERMQRNFLWSGVGEGKRDHLVSWDAVCKLRVKGGLGIGKIPLRNRALLGKWLWRYLRESTTLWHQVIFSIYKTHSNGRDANTLVRWSHRCPWKAIAQVFQDFSKYTRLVVGNGERIRFWEDLWWGDQIFKDQYPRLFRVVMDKSVPIYSILGLARPFSWNFNFCRDLTDYEIEDLERLMRAIDCMNLSTLASDARSWSLLSSGLFTVKSFFTALSQTLDSSPFFPSKFVWKSQVPFKVKTFVWLVAHKKVNTNDLLQLRRPHKALSPDICKLCMGQGESADHLFLHCSVTLGLWHRLFQLAKMDWIPPKNISDMMFINYKGFGKSKRGLVLWQNACIALIWVVWRERNARIFEDKARNSENLWDSIHFIASFWAFCSAGFKGIPLTLLTATIAWPLPAIIYIGIILSTLGAALQSLTGAPRLLAAIANDDILPVLHYFRVAEGSEPHIATLFTALICIGCVIIGNLDLITPTITMFFLLCYAGVNLSCFLLDLLDAPSWRPRWKFHHWSLSLLGAVLCIDWLAMDTWMVVDHVLDILVIYCGVPSPCKSHILLLVSGLKPYGQMLFSSTLYFGSDQPVRLAYILGFRSRASCPYGANYIDASSFSVYFGILPFHL
ncbi:Cation-chloride cotransporter 1 [Vitis vinifera]|uniref:Cation-chloride cotransporter 1 n=1 Tax=Vitis vinifera TaxID=29760 RepID=A0A438INY9_VITVI|nr:Cation-chloride cotransporter 1 [Vitis vinifera]